MVRKSRREKIWNWKIFVIALQMTFAFCFFIGVFWHYQPRSELFNDQSWYYINRGDPVSWAGVSSDKGSVRFPIIKAPFLIQELEGNKYRKIIDVSILLPFFLIMTAVIYYFLYSFFRDYIANKKSSQIFLISFFILLIIDYFFYFHWFPRI